jgi:hypothetical protein
MSMEDISIAKSLGLQCSYCMGISLTAGLGGRSRFANCSSSEPTATAVDGVRDGGEVTKAETSVVLRFARALKVDAGVALLICTAGLG